MSQRLGSTINSPLFMNDPVPVRSTSGSHVNVQKFFTKGGGADSENSGPQTYDRIGGDDDLYNINTEGGAYQLSRKALKDRLEELKPYAHHQVRNLDPERTESFRGIVEALRLLYGSQALYDLVLTDIRDVFVHVNDIKPGTVAAYFVGCFNDDKFPGPVGCSPKCAASLPPTEGTPGYTNCDDLVLIYSEDMFSSLNEKRSTHAFIYIGDENFRGFSHANIRLLRDAGIQNVSLVFGNKDGSYQEINSAMNLDQLPLNPDSNPETNSNSIANSNPNVASTETSNSTGAIVFIVILAIIFILLLAILYRANRQ